MANVPGECDEVEVGTHEWSTSEVVSLTFDAASESRWDLQRKRSAGDGGSEGASSLIHSVYSRKVLCC